MVYVAHIGGDFTDCFHLAAGIVVLAAVVVCHEYTTTTINNNIY